MSGMKSSYRSCMMPRIPIRGLRSDMAFLLGRSAPAAPERHGRSWPGRSALAVFLLVAPVQGVDLVGRDRGQRAAEGAGEVHGARGILAHHRRLQRGPGG